MGSYYIYSWSMYHYFLSHLSMKTLLELEQELNHLEPHDEGTRVEVANVSQALILYDGLLKSGRKVDDMRYQVGRATERALLLLQE